MIPDSINRVHILRAIGIVDEKGVANPRRESKRYDVLYQGRRYPPKYLVSLAYAFVAGRELHHEEFDTYEAQRFLRSLGFEIVDKQNQ